MRYLLVVGFACEVYRREPRARIFVGDTLIDEFYILPHRTSVFTSDKFFLNRYILQPFSVQELLNFNTKDLPLLKFYEIGIKKKCNRLELRIDIENNDSNATNGFLTKSTLIKLEKLFFFPYSKKILSHLNQIKTKNRISNNYAWYKRTKHSIFSIIRNVKWYGNNKKLIDSSNGFEKIPIGGSGYFHCELFKKYGIFITQSIKPHRFHLDYEFIDYFFNKYKQYVNQRNYN